MEPHEDLIMQKPPYFMLFPNDTMKVIFANMDLLSLFYARVVSKQWHSVYRFIELDQLNRYFNLPQPQKHSNTVSKALLSIVNREQYCLWLIHQFLHLLDDTSSTLTVRSICSKLESIALPIFRRHYVTSNWEEIKKQSKIENPNYSFMEHLLDKVAYPVSPIYQVAGIGSDNTAFIQEYVEMIIVLAANNFVKLTLAWRTNQRSEDHSYQFAAVTVKNDDVSQELQLATFYSRTRNQNLIHLEYFNWHNTGVKSRRWTDFAIKANEDNITTLKQWLEIDSTLSNLQLYHFLRLLMLEFKPKSSLELFPTAQTAKEKLSMLLSNKENSPEYHQLFADLLSEIHLLTNKWLIKANLIEVLQKSTTYLHLFYNITPQTKLELNQLIEDMALIKWEEEMAEYEALDEDPQHAIWTSYFNHIIVTFDKLIETQAKNEESIIMEWIVDEWENEDFGYNIPLIHILEPFTSMSYWEELVNETDWIPAHKAKYNPDQFPSKLNVVHEKENIHVTSPKELEISFNMTNDTWERLISVLDLKHVDKNMLCDFFLVVSGLYAFTDGVNNDTKGIRRYYCGEAGTEKLLAFIQDRLSHQGT
jgi:hypothetical protein